MRAVKFMNWKSLISRIIIPLISLIGARYCARSAVEAETYIKSILPNQKLPDSLSNFGSLFLKQLYDLFGDKGLEEYQKFILYRLPSQILIISIIYPIIRDISQYLGRCEMRLDVFTKKKASRFYPTAYMHALTWPFLFADVFQTLLLLSSIQTFRTHQLLFFYVATFSGYLAILKNISLILLLNGLPMAILVSLARIIIIGWKSGKIFRGFRRDDHTPARPKLSKKAN